MGYLKEKQLEEEIRLLRVELERQRVSDRVSSVMNDALRSSNSILTAKIEELQSKQKSRDLEYVDLAEAKFNADKKITALQNEIANIVNSGTPISVKPERNDPDVDTERWCIPGTSVLHREDGPALVRPDYCAWYLFGMQHRINGPSYENSGGNQSWKIFNKYHREDGPALIVKYAGEEVWYRFGLIHRVGGPAVTTRYEHQWWEHGVQLRTERRT